MVKLAEEPRYTWRQAPTDPGLVITKLDVGPDIDEGGSYRAIFSLRNRAGHLEESLEATYGGHGGPIDINPMPETRKAAKKAAHKRFISAKAKLLDLSRRSDHAREFDLATVLEIIVSELISDYEVEKKFRSLIRRGGLIGIREDEETVVWDPYRKYPDVVEYCRKLQEGGRGKDVIEWVHETLGLPNGEPKPHETPYIPKEELWKPPKDLPCLVCGEMIDRKERGTAAVVCRKVTCDTLHQEVMYAAREMVRLSLDKPKAHLGNMRPRFGGHGSAGPIGSMISLAIQQCHFEWPSEEVRDLGAGCFRDMHEAFRILAHVSREGKMPDDDRAPLFVPTVDEICALTDKFPPMLEEALEYERNRKDD